ncbi:Peroxisomal biogenesis factor 19 [Habropoda laboriosa]|uniref:Peroxin-19 n=1 Tax=Habropoda laboriosa TaxID=597456 RepID=A0A0L7QJ63_9HYME|nr:PREDICTED: peroxisomal biogenesis factor 19-like isoform X3 [Habropoda laboriosa]KOC58576.1 Peroxisomal biogenesis factor 19 [Habropoda laboriosa]KOC68799.1 Peroxisomal biogenesis factor 19 [Habropoda laboriosa]
MADEKATKQAEDQELNDLLDSALEDFNKEQKSDKKDASKIGASESTTDKNVTDILEDTWSTDDAGKLLFKMMFLNGNNGELGVSPQTMARKLTSPTKDEDTSDKDIASIDFQSAIAGAMNDLSITTENLQNGADLSEIFGQAALEDCPDVIPPFLQVLLEHLLSKELLYPAMKQLAHEYPELLEEKKTTIPSNDLQRFTKQFELIQQICTELEKETDEDTAEMKKKRFETKMSLMQEVLSCGQLPEELIGPTTRTDAEGDPVIPALLRNMEPPQHCCLM